ncbi:type VII secretion protein EccB [Corynebacterium lizhenjunii]|uniref:type VII secretion protein EccB n=1 Tax=Corynebacterium lizhenjunii TaxID=2709394 RepID=UPI0013EB27A3|nr:type VII secretion protein EccB [Corynebacterium lizhenjunii]
MARVRPTTKAQISGHKFLKRRVEHGLVLGDIRMIHDPLGRRQRAGWVSLGVSVVAVAGAGLMAWVSPNPQPGEAPVLVTPGGQVLARVEQTYHPVPNVVSAQLITGTSQQPVRVGEQAAAQLQLGRPAGIADAPGYLAATPPAGEWAVCHEPLRAEPARFPTQVGGGEQTSGRTVVYAGLTLQDVAADEALLATQGEQQWLVDAAGRHPLPSGALGEAIVRALEHGGEPLVRRELPVEVLRAIPVQPEYSSGSELPQVWDTGAGMWARSRDGVFALSDVQAEILLSMGATRREVGPPEVAQLPQVEPTVVLPQRQVRALGAGWLCATGTRVGVAEAQSDVIPLAGQAGFFGGLSAGGVAVETEHARLVVSATGTAHVVGSAADWEALGIETPARASWDVVRLLPQGPELSRDAALG